jgi:hypothetical protein
VNVRSIERMVPSGKKLADTTAKLPVIVLHPCES